MPLPGTGQAWVVWYLSVSPFDGILNEDIEQSV